MTDPLRIVQISDLHLDISNSKQAKNSNENALTDIISALSKKKFDLMIISGDLVEKPIPVNYERIHEIINQLPFPAFLMSGNHDSPDLMNRIFQLEKFIHSGKLAYSLYPKNFPLFIADTSTSELSIEQIKMLKKEAACVFPRELLLFIHHPPVTCGCLFMDKNYPLKNSLEAWNEIKSIENLNHIFCGHYHTDKELTQDGKRIYLTPSTKMQIRPDSADFAIEHENPGYREIEWDGKTLKTRVHLN